MRYDDEFRRQAVEAFRAAREGTSSDAAALREVAASFNVPVSTLRGWVRAARGNASVTVIPAAAGGGVEASVIEIVGAPDPESLEGTYVASVAAMDWLTDTDNALVRLGLEYARQIDAVIKDPEVDPQTKTKTLYLGPHLIGTLRELGGTPGARKELTKGEENVGGKLAALRNKEGGRKRA